MQQLLTFHGKYVCVTMSEAAVAKSKEMASPLLLEIQVYFSCVLVKRVAIYTSTPLAGAWQLDDNEFSSLLETAQILSGKLFLRFNTVMTKTCPVSDYLGPPPVSDFDIVRKEAFVPSWLKVDYLNGEWIGDYGWHEHNKKGLSTVQIRGNVLPAP